MNIITPEELDDINNKRLLYKYNGIFISNNQENEMEIKDMEIPNYEQNYFDLLTGKKPLSSTKNYFLEFINESYRNQIRIYDANENGVNKISLNLDDSDIIRNAMALELIYNEKILIIFLNKKFKFYIFSDDYIKYKSYSLQLESLSPLNYMIPFENNLTESLLKINSNNILLIYNNQAYVISFDENLKEIIQCYQLNLKNILKADKVYYYNKDGISDILFFICLFYSVNIINEINIELLYYYFYLF